MKKDAKDKRYRYGKCECGGNVVERLQIVHRRFHGRLFEFENVPVGVCDACSQRVYRGPVLMQLQRMAESRIGIKKVVRVPIIEFQAA